MGEMQGVNSQSEWRTGWDKMKGWISEKWNADYQLIQLKHGGEGTGLSNSKWQGVMSKGSGCYSTTWRGRNSIDGMKQAIQEQWDEGNRILDISGISTKGGHMYWMA